MNPYEGSLVYDSNHMPVTSKQDTGSHGFGTKSMKNIVEYEAPAIEVSEVRLECGIAASIRTEDYVETEGVW